MARHNGECCDVIPRLTKATVIYDDTNVFLNQEREGVSGKLTRGSLKKQSLLGQIQRVFVRRLSQEEHAEAEETVQVHVPAQVLPKANGYTIRDRLLKWSIFSAHGCYSPAKL